jgi:hypothetical protein
MAGGKAEKAKQTDSAKNATADAGKKKQGGKQGGNGNAKATKTAAPAGAAKGGKKK